MIEDFSVPEGGTRISFDARPEAGSYKVTVKAVKEGPFQVTVNGDVLAEKVDLGEIAEKEYQIKGDKVVVAVYRVSVYGWNLVSPDEKPIFVVEFPIYKA